MRKCHYCQISEAGVLHYGKWICAPCLNLSAINKRAAGCSDPQVVLLYPKQLEFPELAMAQAQHELENGK